MEIKVVVPDVTLGTVLGDVYGRDEDGEAYVVGQETVGDKVAQRIAEAVMKSPEYTGLKERVTAIRNEQIAEALGPIIEEALTKPIQPTNMYGQPVGTGTTLTELIMEKAREAWTTAARDRYGSNTGPSVPQLIETEVRKHLATEVVKARQETQEAALKALGDIGGTPLVQAIKKALGEAAEKTV